MGAIAPVRLHGGAALEDGLGLASLTLNDPASASNGSWASRNSLITASETDTTTASSGRIGSPRSSPRQRGAQALGLALAGGELRVELALALVGAAAGEKPPKTHTTATARHSLDLAIVLSFVLASHGPRRLTVRCAAAILLLDVELFRSDRDSHPQRLPGCTCPPANPRACVAVLATSPACTRGAKLQARSWTVAGAPARRRQAGPHCVAGAPARGRDQQDPDVERVLLRVEASCRSSCRSAPGSRWRSIS